MIRKLSLVAAALALAATAALALAQDGKKSAKINGFLIDNMCASSHGTDKEAKEHETSCALMPACEKSGFAVLSKDVVYKLDERGNKLALALLKETKTKKGVAVAVEGTLENGVLHVDSFEEVPPAN
jgi:FKBP-type peptidyl-prolyl cis-trans isomerase